jgi:hypothetical protein
LVSDPKDHFFANIPIDWLITRLSAHYTSALVALASYNDPVIAQAIAIRAVYEMSASDTRDRLSYAAIVCGLLSHAGSKKVKSIFYSTLKLEKPWIDWMTDALRAELIECEPTEITSFH